MLLAVRGACQLNPINAENDARPQQEQEQAQFYCVMQAMAVVISDALVHPRASLRVCVPRVSVEITLEAFTAASGAASGTNRGAVAVARQMGPVPALRQHARSAFAFVVVLLVAS